MTTNTTTRFDEFENDSEPATQLQSGDEIDKHTSGDRFEVIRANPFEAYVENVDTGRKLTIDTRRISNGPFAVV